MRLLAPALLTSFLLGCGSHELVPIGRDTEEQLPSPTLKACELPALDTFQLSALGPSDRSHWLQPWRAFRDTWPAERMRNAPGFQVGFPPNPAGLGLFQDAGFKHFSIEVGWTRQAYDAPDGVTAELQAALDEIAAEAKQAGLRPMLLLNAPTTSGPSQTVNVALSAAAAAGARSVQLSAQDAAKLIPHKSLFTPTMSPTLVDSVAADGQVLLARPLPQALPAGAAQVKQLRYAPFTRPTLPSGMPNPEYEETLAGWLAYLTTVCSAMRDTLGSTAFDVELWNETSAGNNYETFDINTLYDPPLEADRSASFDDNLNAIRERSASWLRAPERNLSGMGIADGSGNMRFLVTSASEPSGITALSRHVSAQGKSFPEEAELGPTPSIDALGEPNGALAGENWQEAFTPSYAALFPEQSLTALYPPDARRPPQIVRDLSPLESLDVRGLSHQRGPLQDGVPVPDVWLTAVSMNLSLADQLGLTLTPADRLHAQAKALLRTFSAYVGAGAGLVSIYGPNLDTVRYFDLGQPAGGEALLALGRFFMRFESEVAEPRQLELLGVTSCAPGREFAGDGSTAHPDLDHRGLVAFFPFQTGARSFVVPVYVMTRNLLSEQAGATGEARFDLPPEHFELRLRGLLSASASVTLYDPLRDSASEVSVLERNGDELVLGLGLVDYPLLLELQD